MKPDELRETAALLRRLLQQVEDGSIADTSPRDISLLRRIEGAAAALEEASKGTGACGARKPRGQARRRPA